MSLLLAPILGAPVAGVMLAWVLVRFEERARRARRRREAAAVWERFALRRRELRVSVDPFGEATLHGIARGVKWSLARRPWGAGTRLVVRAAVRGLSPSRVEGIAVRAAGLVPGGAVARRDGALELATTLEEWELDDGYFDAVRELVGALAPSEALHATA